MTNDSWQEFKPWLRDVLLAWHRMDPVSDKEKTRAIEVNKIQGNRNPFIDYPELVEFIWGN
jgi:endonuclease I